MVRAEDILGLDKEERHLPKKLRAVWSGPYPITAVLPRDTYHLQLPKDLKLHPEFHISKLKPFPVSDQFDREEPGSPPAWDVEQESPQWEVESILRHRFITGRKPAQFQVKWLGAPVTQASWRTYAELQGCLGLLEEYMHRHNLHAELLELQAKYQANIAVVHEPPS